MDELLLIDEYQQVEPCDVIRAQLNAHGTERTMSLSTLKGTKGQCVWCETKLVGRQQRWCGINCVRSAQFLTAPQSPDAKIYRLIFTQNFACARCGESFEQDLRRIIRKAWQHQNSRSLSSPAFCHWPPGKISLHRVGYCTGDRWQTDHIIPIHLGGRGIDPRNLQVLCVPCHKDKTKEDLSGRV